MTNQYYIGIDLGLPNKYTGVSIVEKIEQPEPDFSLYPPELRPLKRREWEPYRQPVKYVVRTIKHMFMKTTSGKKGDTGTKVTYTYIVEELTNTMSDPRLSNAIVLLNATNVGRAVTDHIRQKLPAEVITVGANMTAESDSRNVPYIDIVMTTRQVFEERRISVVPTLPFAMQLSHELDSITPKRPPQDVDLYKITHASDYADLYMATAIAVWYAETRGGRIVVGEVPDILANYTGI